MSLMRNQLNEYKDYFYFRDTNIYNFNPVGKANVYRVESTHDRNCTKIRQNNKNPDNGS